MVQPLTCKIEDCEGWPVDNLVGNLPIVSIKISSYLESNLFCANTTSCDDNSNKLFLVGWCTLSHRITWSLADIFSINSIASSGVFCFIFPPAEASNNCLDYGLSPSINIFSWVGSESPWVGVFLKKPRNLSTASLRDSSGNWWNDEIATFPSVVFDSEKYFFRNFSTTSSHVFRLFPLNEWSHLLASTAKENENKLSLMASLVLQQSSRCYKFQWMLPNVHRGPHLVNDKT